MSLIVCEATRLVLLVINNTPVLIRYCWLKDKCCFLWVLIWKTGESAFSLMCWALIELSLHCWHVGVSVLLKFKRFKKQFLQWKHVNLPFWIIKYVFVTEEPCNSSNVWMCEINDVHTGHWQVIGIHLTHIHQFMNEKTLLAVAVRDQF